MNDNYRKVAATKILLVLKTLIQGDKYIEARFLRQLEQFAILLSAKSHFRRGYAIMPAEVILEFSRDALV